MIIGLAAPGGYYSPFAEKYLDYVSWLKNSLVNATSYILSLFQVKTHAEPGFVVKFNGGKGVFIARDCVGYGVYSFWIAFVAANTGTFWKKICWILGGLLLLWFINVIRITLFLTAVNKGWAMPLGIDHHTWFTIAAYGMIFLLILLYDGTQRNKIRKEQKNSSILHEN
jgi:exosortase/archaeosortase family protein